MTKAVNTVAINTNLTAEAAKKVADVTVTLSSTSKTTAHATLEQLSVEEVECHNTSGLCCLYFKAVGFGKMINNDMSAVHEEGFYRKVPCFKPVKEG